MPTPVELQILLESFSRNSRVTRQLLDTLTLADLNYSDGVGGFNIGQHLADTVEFRRYWLSRVAPEFAEGLKSVTASDSPTWLAVGSIAELQAAFDEGDEAVKSAVTDAVSAGRSFAGVYESHPAHLLQHCVVHDSHHRGQILTLLRQAGRPAELREELESKSWQVWRE